MNEEETLVRPFTLSYQKEEGESWTASFIECATLEELLERVNIAAKTLWYSIYPEDMNKELQEFSRRTRIGQEEPQEPHR